MSISQKPAGISDNRFSCNAWKKNELV